MATKNQGGLNTKQTIYCAPQNTQEDLPDFSSLASHAQFSITLIIPLILSAKRDGTAERFLRKVLGASHTQTPRASAVDKNAAYPIALKKLKKDQTKLKVETQLRQSKYLNNIIEQDHRNVKRIVNPMMGFQSFNTARRSLRAIEAMTMIRKGQVKGINQGDSVSQVKFINKIFGVVA